MDAEWLSKPTKPKKTYSRRQKKVLVESTNTSPESFACTVAVEPIKACGVKFDHEAAKLKRQGRDRRRAQFRFLKLIRPKAPRPAHKAPVQVLSELGLLSPVSIHSGRMSIESAASISSPVGSVTPFTKRHSSQRSFRLSNRCSTDSDLGFQLSRLSLGSRHNASSASVNRSKGAASDIHSVLGIERKEQALAFAFRFLDHGELLRTVPTVSQSWKSVAVDVMSWRAVRAAFENSDDTPLDAGAEDELSFCGVIPAKPYRRWRQFCAAFPWGTFIGDGAYKQVFKVFNRAIQTEEACSVMDVQSIKQFDNLPAVLQEVKAACMVSALVRWRRCINFMETKQVFMSAYNFPEALWGTEAERAPQGRAAPSALRDGWPELAGKWPKGYTKLPRAPRKLGEYMMMRMELCDGDVESYLRTIDEIRQGAGSEEWVGSVSVIDAELGAGGTAETVALFSQMALSIAAAQSELQMRHYDVKLLNFLLVDSNRVTDQLIGNPAAPDTMGLPGALWLQVDTLSRCQVESGWGLTERTWSGNTPFVVKLTDFGTAETDAATMDQPIQPWHLTTLENTPPEFLFDGTRATQSFSADAWGLGLCLVHMLTGVAPYEELMAEVECPGELRRLLHHTWRSNERYSPLWPHLDDEEDPHLLADTLYRYAVLFGVEWLNAGPTRNEVWHALKFLTIPEETDIARKFADDCALWSIGHGSAIPIATARRKLKTENLAVVLKGLTRPTQVSRMSAYAAVELLAHQ